MIVLPFDVFVIIQEGQITLRNRYLLIIYQWESLTFQASSKSVYDVHCIFPEPTCLDRKLNGKTPVHRYQMFL